MIPKVIHYCWFGRKPLPESALKCIQSWKAFLPDYKIIEWNEDNFDIDIIPYVRQAYDAGKYAFVSDYARFWVLYNHGGLYFDTDVEVVKPLDDILAVGPYMGCEETLSGAIAVNPGLGFAAEPEMPFLGELLNYYKTMTFINADGSLNMTTIVTNTTDVLSRHGFVAGETVQQCGGFMIYPKDYFCPIHYGTGRCTLTENTRTIHHYMASWHSAKDKWAMFKRRFFTEAQIKAISAFLDKFRKAR